ncbi:MAG: hypothetical protein J0L81_03055 [Caulobacterales bacterium]|nr:hypothetical protein [Caulobacterales bacterium]
MQLSRTSALDVRNSRAEMMLAGAIALVALLVIALMLAFNDQQRLHARTLETIGVARSVRDETVSIGQALLDVEASRRFPEAMRESAIADAKSNARAHLEALQRHCAATETLAAAAARIVGLVEEDFQHDAERLAPRASAEFSRTYRSNLRAAIEELRLGVNAFNDVARTAERRARQQLDQIAIALGVLALIAVGLSALTLRRERARWRLARDAAEAARANASAADAAKTRFLAVASHDMRQPLHALTLYLSALERRVQGDEARDIVKKMERATQSMSGMFATLLDLARVQAGAVTPVPMATPLQEIFDRIAAEHPSGNLQVSPSPFIAHTDPMLLERALSNLAANAIKHGGGKARLEARAVEGAIDVTVSDDGPGIAPEDQERIFDEFIRLDGRNSDGVGLGLAIVKRISVLLHAPLELVSAPGEGARFSLRLPRAEGEALTPGASMQEQGLAGAIVLLLDDDALAREAIAGALRDLGGEVTSCANEAQIDAALAGGLLPELLVIDLRIDGELQGIAIAARARAKLAIPPPTIVITGDTGPETLAALRASGHAWLIKPVATHILAETIRMVRGGRAA